MVDGRGESQPDAAWRNAPRSPTQQNVLQRNRAGGSSTAAPSTAASPRRRPSARKLWVSPWERFRETRAAGQAKGKGAAPRRSCPSRRHVLQQRPARQEVAAGSRVVRGALGRGRGGRLPSCCGSLLWRTHRRSPEGPRPLLLLHARKIRAREKAIDELLRRGGAEPAFWWCFHGGLVLKTLGQAHTRSPCSLSQTGWPLTARS